MRNFLRSPGRPLRLSVNYQPSAWIAWPASSHKPRTRNYFLHTPVFSAPLPPVLLLLFFYIIILSLGRRRWEVQRRRRLGSWAELCRNTAEQVKLYRGYSRFQIESIAASQQGTRVSIKVERSDYSWTPVLPRNRINLLDKFRKGTVELQTEISKINLVMRNLFEKRKCEIYLEN